MHDNVLMHVPIERIKVATVARGEERLEYGLGSAHGDLPKLPSEHNEDSIPQVWGFRLTLRA
jgi:hypothetical protein